MEIDSKITRIQALGVDLILGETYKIQYNESNYWWKVSRIEKVEGFRTGEYRISFDPTEQPQAIENSDYPILTIISKHALITVKPE